MAGKVMTKAQLVAHLAAESGISKKQAATVLDGLAAITAKQAKTAGQGIVPGIGKVVKVARKARMGRNPQTGEGIKIPARTVARFRLAKVMKDAVVPPKK